MIKIFKKTSPKTNPSTQKIKDEITEICTELEKTNIWFQTEVESDLIEACILQREVLNARYRHLISKMKLLEPSLNKEN
mgnify:CR=1 FL=1